MTTPAPLLFPPDSTSATTPNLVSDPQRNALVFSAANFGPCLVALVSTPGLAVVAINETGTSWIDPQKQSDPATLKLQDILGIQTLTLLSNEILPHAHILGRWRGALLLRDVWGSEFPASATMTFHPDATGQSKGFFCLQAIRTDQAAGDDVDNPPVTDRELLRGLLNAVPESIYFKDRNSRFMRVSQAMADKDGCSDPSVLVGLTDFDRFTAEHARPAFEDEQRILKSGKPILNIEERETWPDGRVTWVSTSKFPLLDGLGRVVGTFGISRNITAAKEAEAERLRINEKLKLAYKMESVGRLAAGVAHEVNTPTQFITDNTHFLRESFAQLHATLSKYREDARTAKDITVPPIESPETVAELDYLFAEIPRCIDQTLEGLGRVARIVKSLKEFSHPHSKAKSLANINHAVDTALEISRHEWKYLADVVTELDPALPDVECVLDEINQVMLNLIVNAGHAIESALAQDKQRARGKITIRTRREGELVVIEVEDTGTGIPKAIVERIFEPFFTTKEVGKGSGQGLAIVHTVITQSHHGTIDVKTEVGAGTTFIMKLPIRQSHHCGDAI